MRLTDGSSQDAVGQLSTPLAEVHFSQPLFKSGYSQMRQSPLLRATETAHMLCPLFSTTWAT